ncbi:hypothetical protein [Bradyrhizobium sp. SZCCHNRI20481]|uniref:hypothetical protein n=1 Tax=Bradyrhizobium sp. SZCCHNRI20481 TaxID=3057286 RepID=UPI002916251E|nr:hypothetical protein [Bradyrhizobium sp. SZCCHNRI20481]
MVVTGLLRGEWRAAFAGIAVAAMLVAATSAAAQAQAPAPDAAAPAPGPAQTTVERNAKGVAGKPIQVGIYLNVQPDCSSGPLPSIRLLTAPGNGTVTIKRGKVSATNYKQCLALEVPGFIAFYQSKADFAGTDTVTLEVKFPQGRTEVQRIMINVGVGPAGQKI